MKTFQDLEKAGQNEEIRMAFVLAAINDHKTTDLYKTAFDAEEYDRRNNITIMQYQKILYKITGEAVADKYSPNHKIPSNFLNLFTTQENQYLLANGMKLENPENKEKLGKDFDEKLQTMGRNALVEGVSFGYWDSNHLVTYKLTEFVPLYDEETSALRAGIRFFQIAPDKPLQATLYEQDGCTDYITDDDGKLKILNPKRNYVNIVQSSEADGAEIVATQNYEGFPIIPMWGNKHHQSELVGLRESIDAYDLIASGGANDLDGSLIYWVLQNSGGMDDVDVAKFMNRLRTVGVAMPEDESEIAPHEIPIPFEARETYLARLERDMYRDCQALNVTEISSGNKTATEIRMAYQAFDNKVNDYEYCVIEFLRSLFKIVGFDDNPTFTRDKVATQNDDLQTLLMAENYLDDEYMIPKICAILGDPDAAQDILDRRAGTDLARFFGASNQNQANQTSQNPVNQNQTNQNAANQDQNDQGEGDVNG